MPQCAPLRLKRSALRGFFHPRLAAAALFGLLASGAPAEADELVSFTSAGQGEAIQGYLSRPKGAGPFPAVVLLHTCLGLPAERASIGERIAAWGYVALFVDDFATRGLKETCAVDFQPSPGRRRWRSGLSGQPSLCRPAPDRGGRVFSRGRHGAQDRTRGGAAGFKAAAAFYAPCANVAGAALANPDAHPRRREGRGDPRARTAPNWRSASARHGEARRLSRRGPRLRPARVRRRPTRLWACRWPMIATPLSDPGRSCAASWRLGLSARRVAPFRRSARACPDSGRFVLDTARILETLD